MQTQNKLLDDLARVASGALGVAAGMREEVESRLRDQFERVLARMDLVSREEFDAVRAMAAKAREEQETLAERVAALEKAVATTASGGSRAGGSKAGASKATRAKSAAKPKKSAAATGKTRTSRAKSGPER